MAQFYNKPTGVALNLTVLSRVTVYTLKYYYSNKPIYSALWFKA